VNPEKRRLIFERLRAANPAPTTELAYRTPYELLVAVVLSAQATDKSVNLATAKLYPVANTPQAIVALGEEKLRDYIRTIGLYRTKAKNVVALSQLLLDRHGAALETQSLVNTWERDSLAVVEAVDPDTVPIDPLTYL